MVRDVVCNEMPRAFSDHRRYATCLFIGGWILVAAQAFALPGWIAQLMVGLIATGLRVAAIAGDWRLPACQATRSP